MSEDTLAVRLDGRSRTQRAFAVALAIVILATPIAALTATGSWSRVGVPAIEPSYADLRAITSAVDCYEQNSARSVFLTDCDPLHRPYNYPSLWVRAFAAFGLGSNSAALIGAIESVAYVLAVALVLWLLGARRPLPLLVVCVAALTSPALLGLERGNSDLMMFALLAAFLALLNARRPVAATLVLSVAAVMKLYPLGAVALLPLAFRSARRGLVAGALVIAAALALLVPEFGAISAATPFTWRSSFGDAVLWLAIREHLPAALAESAALSDPTLFLLLGLLTYALVAVGLVWMMQRLPSFLEWTQRIVTPLLDQRATAFSYLTGMLVIGTAYTLGSSFDYRLIFVTFAIAAVAIAARPGNVAAWVFVGAWMLVLLVSGGPVRSGPLGLAGDAVMLALVPYSMIIAAQVWIAMFEQRDKPANAR